MAETEILPQKIVDTRTFILKPRLDSNRVKWQGEKFKTSFFVRFGFLKPKPKDILLVAFSKYYEPYIVIGGKYAIDYCKRHSYALKVEDKTQAIFIDGKKLKPEPLSAAENAKVIKLVGEEHSHYENETYIILDRMLQEVSADKLFFAPSEKDLENRPDVDFALRKPQISLEEEIAFLRSRIAKRPPDVAEIIREIFEINERTIIYSPFYELTYKNMKNGKKVIALINGASGGVILSKFDVKASKNLRAPLEACPEDFSVIRTRSFPAEPEQWYAYGGSYVSNSTNKKPNENLIVEDRENNIAPNPHQLEDSFWLDAENTPHLATDFMRRLGYKQGQFPTNLYVDGETAVVDLKLQEENARVQIDTKTKEVKPRKSRRAKFKKQRRNRVFNSKS